MASLLINPRYALPLWHEGLRAVTDFIRLDGGIVVGGHASRNVAFFHLAGVGGFLKREYRLPWKDKAAGWWAGYGWVPKSLREWQVLRMLPKLGISCPEAIAAGDDGRQAFLFVRALPHAVDVMSYLSMRPTPSERSTLLEAVGSTIARLHSGGFTHPDLYAKHLFWDPTERVLSLIDFQRTRFGRTLTWRERARDWAALHASLHASLVGSQERMQCLQVYLEAARLRPSRERMRQFLCAITARRNHLLGRRKIQAMQQAGHGSNGGAAEVMYWRVRPQEAIANRGVHRDGLVLEQQGRE